MPDLQMAELRPQLEAGVPVGGLQEEGPPVHLLGHVHVVLAPHGHGPGLCPQVLRAVVHVVRILAQLGEVVDLEGGTTRPSAPPAVPAGP